MIDPGLAQDLVTRGVADEHVVAAATAKGDRLLVRLHDHEIDVVLLELPRDLFSDAAEATEDVVVTQVLNLTSHTLTPQYRGQLALDQELEDSNERVEDDADAGDRESDREDPPYVVQRTDLGEADRGEDDDCHVEGIEQRPALENHVADRADSHQRADDSDGADDVLRQRVPEVLQIAYHVREALHV